MESKRRSSDIGDASERVALAFLQGKGLVLVERNFRCRQGELDLIMRDGNTLVFVEVRRRSQSRYGNAAESITWRKRSRLLRTSDVFLASRKQWRHAPMRFDVVALDGNAATISWFPNAITPDR